mgnify:CR=1 FL=1
MQRSIVVLLPAYNEEVSIAVTIQSFKKALPKANIWVCDNNSTDNTAQEALNAGAQVITQRLKGKGNAFKMLICNIEADIYVLADADDTYEAAAAPTLIDVLIKSNLDMVIGSRVGNSEGQYRAGHKLGNKFFSNAFSVLFGMKVDDLFSGYRVFSKRFAKTFPSISKGFEIETEINAHLITYSLPFQEIPTKYSARAEGSESKLNKINDGFRILYYLLIFLRDHSPLKAFSYLGVFLSICCLILFFPIYFDFLNTGEVDRFPTLFISVVLGAGGLASFFTALILDGIKINRRSNFMHQYHNWTSK